MAIITSLEKFKEFLKKNSNNSFEIQKAVVSTPRDPDTGGTDLNLLERGDSAWITVTDPSSPLHGRPILITKRPDNLLALTGGAGVQAQARRHMVLGGTPEKTESELESEEQIKKIEEENAPIEDARRDKKRAVRDLTDELKPMIKEMEKALGIKDMDPRKLAKKKDEIKEFILNKLGEDTNEEEAAHLSNLITRYYARAEREVKSRVRVEREKKIFSDLQLQKKFKGEDRGEFVFDVGEEGDENLVSVEEKEKLPEDIREQIESVADDYTPMDVTIPDINDLVGKTPVEQESIVANHFDNAAEEFFADDRVDHPIRDEDDEEDEKGLSEPPPKIELGVTVEPLKFDYSEDISDAVSTMRNFVAKKKEIDDLTDKIKKVPLSVIRSTTMNSLLEEIREADFEADVTPEDLADMASENYEQFLTSSSALAFYDTLGTMWSDGMALTHRIDDRSEFTSMKFQVDAGAATALTALSRKYLGYGMDTLRLIRNGSLELAVASVALEIKNKHEKDTYDEIIRDALKYQSENQIAAEREAISKHQRLDTQYQEILRQEISGELVDQVHIHSLKTDNLIEQRVNMGSAFGSLQASGTFVDYLMRFRNGSSVASVNVGSRMEDADAIVKSLGLNKLKRKTYDIDVTDPNNIQVKIGLGSFGRIVSRDKDTTARNDAYEAIKTNMDDVVEDDDGNLQVENYDVPLWKDSYMDDNGDRQKFNWRVEQRNDIEWFNEMTKPTEENPDGVGGGTITRVTGAGKTASSLGFFAGKINDNPDYKAVVAVPRGRSEQWIAEAEKFSDLKMVHIPDGSSKQVIEETLASAAPGSIVVTGHREVSRGYDILNDMQQGDDKFHGISIDEPQTLIAKGQRGNIGSQGKKIMKLPFGHRMALTATIARNNASEAYDIVKWASQAKDLGSRASFVRMYGGFGGGVNAQDTATAMALQEKIGPYISGSRITQPTFQTKRSDIGFKKTDSQIARQKELESNSADIIDRRVTAISEDVRNNPNHPLRRTDDSWERNLRSKATKQARGEVRNSFRAIMDGGNWQENSKFLALGQNFESAGPDKKHVVFIDSKEQRQTLSSMLKDMGVTTPKIKNIASTATSSISGREMAARAKSFQKDPNVNFIIIDSSSASGYNLQQGDAIHFIGDPKSAETYLQAQGRIARMPREGDIDIMTYKFDDDVDEQSRWRGVENQIKLIAATTPALTQI